MKTNNLYTLTFNCISILYEKKMPPTDTHTTVVVLSTRDTGMQFDMEMNELEGGGRKASELCLSFESSLVVTGKYAHLCDDNTEDKQSHFRNSAILFLSEEFRKRVKFSEFPSSNYFICTYLVQVCCLHHCIRDAIVRESLRVHS